MAQTEAEEMVRLYFIHVFFSEWCGLKSYLNLSEAGGHVVWAKVWAFSQVDGLFARFRAPEICLGDKLRGGTTVDRAFKAVQLDWRASVCLPTAWLLNPAILVLTICPKSSQGWDLQLLVNTWYWHKQCCSTKSVNGGFCRKCNLMWQHLQLNNLKRCSRRGYSVSLVKPANFQ